VTLLWMVALGEWLDHQQRVLSMSTWFGHHEVVLASAAAALVSLAVMAPFTSGFSEGTRRQISFLVAICFASVVGMAGVLALALPLAAGVGVGVLSSLRR
jgi:hypothetical protein